MYLHLLIYYLFEKYMSCNIYKIIHSSNRLKYVRVLFIRHFIKSRPEKK